MARTVADAARAARRDRRARSARRARPRASDGKAVADYTTFLDPAGLKGARIGVHAQRFGFHDRSSRVIEAALDAMKHAGAVIVDPANMPTKGKFDDAEIEVLLYEFKDGLNAYLAALRARR